MVTNRGKRHHIYPVGCLFLGITLASLHQLSGPTLSRCHGCGHEFGRRTILAKIGLSVLILIAVGIATLFALALFSDI